MAYFFFHLNESGSTTEDLEGQELPHLEAARTMAIHAVRSLMCHEIISGTLCFARHIDIVGPDGVQLERVEFSDAVTVTGYARFTPRPPAP